jgi:PilZ domain
VLTSMSAMQARDRHFVDGVTCVLDGNAMRVANLSLGGLFAATELRPPDPGQLVVLELRLPSHPPFRVVGQVTWVNEPRNPADLPPGFGVRITQIAAGDKDALTELLRRSDAVLAQPRRGH